MADTAAHVAKVMDIIAKVNSWIQKIKDKIEWFQEKLGEIIQKANETIQNAIGATQKFIDDKLRFLQEKYDKFHAEAQTWVNDQLQKVKDWVKEQIATVQHEWKMAFARSEAQIIECSTDKKLTPEQIEALSEIAPPLPIPDPQIPELPVPKPPFPIPAIDVTGFANDMVAASGFNDVSAMGNDLANKKII